LTTEPNALKLFMDVIYDVRNKLERFSQASLFPIPSNVCG